MDDSETTHKRGRKLKYSHILIVLLLIVVGAFVVFRLSVRSKLRSKIDAIRAAGYPVTCEELDQWYSIPETAENAAYIILDAFEFYQKPQDSKLLPLLGKAELPARNIPLSEETKNIIAQYLSDNQKTLELLHEAATFEHSRYPIDLSLGLGTLVPNLQDLRQSVKLLNLEAMIHAEKNESQPATQSLIAGLGIANSLSEEPIIVSQLVRISCQALTVSILERVINRTDFTDEQLVELGRDFTNSQNLSGISRAFVGERCQLLSVFEDPTILTPELFGGKTLPAPILELYKALGLADRDAIVYLDLMNDYIETTQLPLHQRQRAAGTIEAKLKATSKVHILLHKFMPAFSRVITLEIRAIAQLRTARVGLAVQRYRLATGHLPDALADLVPTYLDAVPEDPFDGRELRYEKLETGFVVYSVGEDRRDDGGTERLPTGEKKKAPSSWDITFIVER